MAIMRQRLPQMGLGVPKPQGAEQGVGSFSKPRTRSAGLGQGFSMKGLDPSGSNRPGTPMSGIGSPDMPQVIDEGPMTPGSIPPPASLPGIGMVGSPGPSTQTMLGGGGVGGGGMFNSQQLFSKLNEIIGGDGIFDKAAVMRRTGDARSGLERLRAGEQDTLSAQLAERGLLRSGAESEALSRHSADIGGQTTEAVNEIFGDESNRASDRLMQALGLGAGISTSDKDRELQDRLGSGQLDLGNKQAMMDYLLGTGRLDLDRNRLNSEIGRGDLDRILALIQQMQQGSDRSAGGWWGRN